MCIFQCIVKENYENTRTTHTPTEYEKKKLESSLNTKILKKVAGKKRTIIVKNETIRDELKQRLAIWKINHKQIGWIWTHKQHGQNRLVRKYKNLKRIL